MCDPDKLYLYSKEVLISSWQMLQAVCASRQPHAILIRAGPGSWHHAMCGCLLHTWGVVRSPHMSAAAFMEACGSLLVRAWACVSCSTWDCITARSPCVCNVVG